MKLPKKAPRPFTSGCLNEIYITPELDAKEAAYYQSPIVILLWIVELGRVDITVEKSFMASCMALPQRGHLDQLFCIFSFLCNEHNTKMVIDPSEP